MEEKRIPSLLLRILLVQVEDMMGRRSLIMLLRQTGLAQYIDEVPPRSESPSITIAQYSSLLANIYQTFGAKGGESIFSEGGRMGAVEMRRKHPAQFAVAGVAMRLLPAARRLQLVVERLAEQGEELYDCPHHLHEDEYAFFIEMPDCPYCAEITRRSVAENRPVAKPVCHIPVAAVSETIEWAMGQKHLVEEVNCIALGAPACRFRISK